MRTLSILAAAALLGSATAKVHRLKLDKVPLSEQFVSCHLRRSTRMITNWMDRRNAALMTTCAP